MLLFEHKADKYLLVKTNFIKYNRAQLKFLYANLILLTTARDLDMPGGKMFVFQLDVLNHKVLM
jgi:hypothetical protein